MRRKGNVFRHWQSLIMGLVPALLLPGCARDLIFTTYTTVGVEVKGTNNIPTAMRLAYKRFEGAIVPVQLNKPGNAHSIFAGMEVKQHGFRVQVAQVFATGEAAILAAGGDAEGKPVGARPGRGFAKTLDELKDIVGMDTDSGNGG